MPDLRDATTKLTKLASGLKPGDAPTEASAPLPIRGNPEKVVKLWAKTADREAVLEGIPAAEATLSRGDDQGKKWGTTFVVNLKLEEAMPEVATRELAAKAVRRLKALAETGEIPTTSKNPAYREDAGEES
jgi:hypothetical protein